MVTRYDELCAYVREIESNLARIRATAATFTESRRNHPIPGDYGTVTVSGHGALVSIDIKPETAKFINGKTLGRAITAAIARAEDDAQEFRQQRMNEARRTVAE
jgi:DNA-binding protein YbaB